MNHKKLIIWDFDGPIIDSRELALELTQYQCHDVDEHVHRNLFNGNVFDGLNKLKKKASDEEFSEFLNKSYWPRKMEILPVEGIRGVLEELSNEFDMVINSSSVASQIDSYLAKNDLRKFFLKIYGSEIKSKEEKFKLILKEFNLSAKDCVLITDTVGDVLEAESLSIPSIVILWGYQLEEHFNPVINKVVLVKDPSQLKGAVEVHFSK